MIHNRYYSCRVCKSFLEEGDFIYGFDKRDERSFLLCYDCKKDLDRVAEGKLTEEEFSKSVKKRWEERKKAIDQKIEESNHHWNKTTKAIWN